MSGPERGIDTSSLPPKDAAVALRSFARRYREALQPLEGEENLDTIVERPGVTGRSTMELTVDTTRSLALLDRALEQVLLHDAPVLHLGVVRRKSRRFEVGHHGYIETVVEELADLAIAFAERVERVPGSDWARMGRVAGGGEITALEVLQEAVSTAADNLRDVELTLRQVRGL